MAKINRVVVVTIDGPAGAGKSTVARKVASKLRFVHLNSGALYRAAALFALDRGIELSNQEEVLRCAQELKFGYSVDSDGITHLMVNEEDISARLSQRKAGELASVIGIHPKVRQVMDSVQRSVAQSSSVVVEGRDAGSVVFPSADLKFYLDASSTVRAQRRLQESKERGESGTLEQIERELNDRDHRDSTRTIAPQVQPEGSTRIDTSNLSVDEVVEQICSAVRVILN